MLTEELKPGVWELLTVALALLLTAALTLAVTFWTVVEWRNAAARRITRHAKREPAQPE